MSVAKTYKGFEICVEQTKNPLLVRAFCVDMKSGLQTRQKVVVRGDFPQEVRRFVALIDSGAIEGELVKFSKIKEFGHTLGVEKGEKTGV